MILRAEQLIKRYKQRTVVDRVSIQVEQGEIVGLLGPRFGTVADWKEGRGLLALRGQTE
jgi:ABC-type lipopolysaccharide export system ATPase subunit